MEEDLTSKYVDGRYQPAVIIKYGIDTEYFWLFDGDIKDWNHPFQVIVRKDFGVIRITYYSTEKIINDQPIQLRRTDPSGHRTLKEYYNHSEECSKILEHINVYDYFTKNDIYESSGIEKGQISPLCEEFYAEFSFRFKFAD